MDEECHSMIANAMIYSPLTQALFIHIYVFEIYSNIMQINEHEFTGTKYNLINLWSLFLFII